MTVKPHKIVWTKIDEAPALATYSLLPILQSFVKGTGIEFEERDISLAGRIIANFPEAPPESRRIADELAYLGELVKRPEANVIKLPNISASKTQLKAAIKELQGQGDKVPDYPEEAAGEAEKKLQERYAKVLGSAVNPVLREGNSDRRAAVSVKKYARRHPHRMMKAWEPGSKTHVAHMTQGDFYGSERSMTMTKDCQARIEFADATGRTTVLKEKLALRNGEVLDCAVMSARALREFYRTEIEKARADGLLLSLHLKATMMKVSDPIIFGHAVAEYYRDLFEKHARTFAEIGVNPDNAIGDLQAKIQALPAEKRAEIEADLQEVYKKRPALAMVDSDKGITNLHATNDVIIDASMPVVIRDGGKMWGPDGKLHDTKALIPDRCYATMYQAMIEDCRKNGAYDPAAMGSVSNVGLMAQKAEEYGSHDKTFKAPGSGTIRIVGEHGAVLLEQRVEKDDIFRACLTKDAAIRNWVKLAVDRARASGTAAVFWLDRNRAHDREIITKVEAYLPEHAVQGLDIRTLAPAEAMRFTVARSRAGQDTISVTGNVLRDYLTDLFPILELGTSAKMLSIVPLLNGGGLFETGAGGSAPKHVQQLLKENYLRWDSLGEFCALVASFEHLAKALGNQKAQVLSDTLDDAISKHLENRREPARKVGGLDNRGSHFYLALYWAEALAMQDEDQALKGRFTRIARALSENESKIVEEMLAVQGKPADIGGYYRPDPAKASAVMRPSRTFNAIIDEA